jgi:hypothetical protein
VFPRIACVDFVPPMAARVSAAVHYKRHRRDEP